MSKHKFEKLSRDRESNTKIFVGGSQFTVEQMEKEIESNSKFGKKLRFVDKELDS